MDEIRFDDVTALRARTSETYGTWGPEVIVTQELIDRFADLTGDHQWIHTDPQRARRGPFGATIAHGFLTLALMPAFLPPLGFRVVDEGSRINYGCDSFRFLQPVTVGSTLHARTRLTDVREHASGVLLVKELQVGVVGRKRPALLYNGLHLYRP